MKSFKLSNLSLALVLVGCSYHDNASSALNESKPFPETSSVESSLNLPDALVCETWTFKIQQTEGRNVVMTAKSDQVGEFVHDGIAETADHITFSTEESALNSGYLKWIGEEDETYAVTYEAAVHEPIVYELIGCEGIDILPGVIITN